MALPTTDATASEGTQKIDTKLKEKEKPEQADHLKSGNTVAVDVHVLNQQAKLYPLLDHEIPTALTKRYVIEDHVYYSKNPSIGIVFEDKGQSITAKSSDADDVRAMIELAKSKHWSIIKVTGTAGFKREAWLAASLQGLQMTGYIPTQQYLALFKNAQAKTQNKIELTHNAPTAAEVAIIATASAKGADQKTIQAIKQRVAVTIRKLQAIGVEIPKPKVYDAKATLLKNQAVEVNPPQRRKDHAQPQISRGR